MKRKMSVIAMLMMVVMCVSLAGCSKPKQEEAPTAQAQTEIPSIVPKNYPEKNIEIINPFGAGSTTEAYLRLMMAWVEQEYSLKNKFVLINKEGGGGMIGWTAIAEAKPDGLTIGMVHSPLLQQPIVNPDCKFTKDSFDPIANLLTDPGTIAVLSTSSCNSLEDLIELAKEKPGAVTVACTGLNTSEARTIHMIENAAGVEFKLIPYSGSTECLAATLGGHVDANALNVGNLFKHVKDGSLKLLGVGTSERSKMVPDVPTYKEQGFDIEQYSMRGLAAPLNVDPEIMAFLREAFAKAQQDPEIVKKAEELMLPVDTKTPEQIKESYDKMDKDLRALWAVAPWQ